MLESRILKVKSERVVLGYDYPLSISAITFKNICSYSYTMRETEGAILDVFRKNPSRELNAEHLVSEIFKNEYK